MKNINNTKVLDNNILKTILLCVSVLVLISIVGCTQTPGGKTPGGTKTYGRDDAYQQLTTCKSNLKNLGTACEMHYIDHNNKYPDNLNELQGLLKTIPVCPSDHAEYVYTTGTGQSEDGKSYSWYQIECKNALAAHKDPSNPSKIIGTFDKADTLGFNSIYGLYTSSESDIKNLPKDK